MGRSVDFFLNKDFTSFESVAIKGQSNKFLGLSDELPDISSKYRVLMKYLIAAADIEH